MLVVLDLITLATIAYIDYGRYKIPNVIILGWVATITNLAILSSITLNCIIQERLIASILVAGSYIPFRHIVKCSAGDFKLYGGLSFTLGISDALLVIFISLSFSIFPFASGIKKVPIGFLTFIGYVTFLVLRRRGLL